ncbi:hypothetical protein Hanom_Chr10g00903751 [Helianthus anomalus]
MNGLNAFTKARSIRIVDQARQEPNTLKPPFLQSILRESLSVITHDKVLCIKTLFFLQ